MNQITFTAALATVMATAVIAGCGVPSNGATGSSGASNLTATYGSKCASCHGSSGGGGSARSLKTSTLTEAAWKAVVRSGRSGTSMKAFSSATYSDADLAADYKAITGK